MLEYAKIVDFNSARVIEDDRSLEICYTRIYRKFGLDEYGHKLSVLHKLKISLKPLIYKSIWFLFVSKIVADLLM